MIDWRSKITARLDPMRFSETAPEAVRVKLLDGFYFSLGSRDSDESAWRLEDMGKRLDTLLLLRSSRC
jgi:hypothetical protein